MINSVNFLGSVYTRDFQKIERPKIRQMDCDCFTCSKSSLDKSISQAKAKIIQELNDNNIEYGFTIGPDGTVLDENRGDEHHCSTDSRKILHGSRLLHGHPNPLPLSSGDVSVLLATEADSQEAVMKDGKYSRLTKKEPFVDINGYQNLYAQLEEKLCLMALDEMGIDYKINNHDVANMGRDHIEYQTGRNVYDLSDEEIFEELKHIGINSEDEPEISAKKLKERMYYQLITNPNKYNKERNTIIENNQEIYNFLSGDEGLNVRHKFLEEVADKYNLIYETDLFDD